VDKATTDAYASKKEHLVQQGLPKEVLRKMDFVSAILVRCWIRIQFGGFHVGKTRASAQSRRKKLVEAQWDEIEKIAIGLQSGLLEAFEMFGRTLHRLIGNTAQTDMYMAVVFEVLPPPAQLKMLTDRRLRQSTTVLPMLHAMRAKTKLPKKGRS